MPRLAFKAFSADRIMFRLLLTSGLRLAISPRPSLMADLNLRNSANRPRMLSAYRSSVIRPCFSPLFELFVSRRKPSSAVPAFCSSPPSPLKPLATAAPASFASCMAAFFAPEASLRRKFNAPPPAMRATLAPALTALPASRTNPLAAVLTALPRAVHPPPVALSPTEEASLVVSAICAFSPASFSFRNSISALVLVNAAVSSNSPNFSSALSISSFIRRSISIWASSSLSLGIRPQSLYPPYFSDAAMAACSRAASRDASNFRRAISCRSSSFLMAEAVCSISLASAACSPVMPFAAARARFMLCT